MRGGKHCFYSLHIPQMTSRCNPCDYIIGILGEQVTQFTTWLSHTLLSTKYFFIKRVTASAGVRREGGREGRREDEGERIGKRVSEV